MPLDQTLEIAGETFVTHPTGALFWPCQSLLVMADLHFEKGSSFAARSVFLPPYDTAATLARIGEAIGFFGPKNIVALGDSFHDCRAGERLTAADRQSLRKMQKGRQWMWVAGNHDPGLPQGIGGDCLPELLAGGIHFRHLPGQTPAAAEIAGHLHPVAKIAAHGGSLRRRCFISNGARCIMPAFGAFAGGLNVLDSAFSPLFGPARSNEDFVHVLGQKKVFAIAKRHCAPD